MMSRNTGVVMYCTTETYFFGRSRPLLIVCIITVVFTHPARKYKKTSKVCFNQSHKASGRREREGVVTDVANATVY